MCNVLLKFFLLEIANANIIGSWNGTIQRESCFQGTETQDMSYNVEIDSTFRNSLYRMARR